MENNWKLELRQAPIDRLANLKYLPLVGEFARQYSHNYWVLRDSFGAVVHQLHGVNIPKLRDWNIDDWNNLSESSSRDSGETLLFTDKVPENFSNSNDKVIFTKEGTKDELLTRFSKAIEVATYLNTKNIEYAPIYLNSSKEPNSNAAAYTLGIAMGFSPEYLAAEVDKNRLKDPGWEKNLLSDYSVSEYQDKLYIDGATRPTECFTAETPILMSDGTYKSIADIKIGDEVMAFEGLGELQPCKVIQTFITLNKKVVQLGDIKVTLAHHFLQPDGSFKTLGKIDPNSFLVGVTGKLIPHPGIKPVPGEHSVYNFTVEGLHTYVAGDYRVHNDSLTSLISLGSEIEFAFRLPDGTQVLLTQAPNGEKVTYIGKDIDGDGNTNLLTTIANFEDREMTIIRNEIYDEKGNVIEQDFDVKFADGKDHGQQIGNFFGSSLGQAINSDNVFVDIATDSVLSAVLGNVGDSLHLYFQDTKQGYRPGDSTLTFGQSVEAGFDSFAEDLYNNVKAAGISAVSSFLSAELSDALDVGNSFGGQLFSSVANNVTSTVITGISSGQSLETIFQGFKAADIITNVGSFLGGYLAKEIIAPESTAGSIGGSIGGTLGGSIGSAIAGIGSLSGTIGTAVLNTLGLSSVISSFTSTIAGFILPGIGVLVGTLIGTLLGDWIDEQWGDEPRAWASLQLDPTSGDFYLSNSWKKEGGKRKFAIEVAEASRDTLNNYLELIDGVHLATNKLYHRYGHREEKLYVNFGEKEIRRSTPQEMVNLGVIDTLKRLRLAGGDLFLKRAIEKTLAKTIEELNGDLQIAQDYARYLENKDVIDLLIALEPNSAFSAAWVVTLIRAEELGITDWSKSDFYGGLKAFFEGMGLDKIGATLDNLNISVNGTTLKIEVVIDGEVVRTIEIADIEQKIGYKYLGANGTGTPGNDIWIAQDIASKFIDSGTANDGESNDILIGGSGNDTINAGLGWDFVRGNGGNDLIVGSAGNDALFGGDGDDTLQGDENVSFAAIPTGVELSDGAISNAIPVSDITRQTWFGGELSAPKYEEYPTSATEDGSFPNDTPTNTHLIFRNDEVHGGAGNDQIAGGEGSDRLFGDTGNDTLYGDAGNDLLDGGEGADILYGGAGYDAASYATATAGVSVDLAGGTFKGTASDGDELYSIEDMIGSDFSDTLSGDAFANLIDGGGGADTIDGRSGRDAVSFFSQDYGVEVDLSAGQARVRIPSTGGGTERVITDTLLNIEDAIGSDHDDTLKGSVAGGLLDGGAGHDIIQVKNDDLDVAGGAASSDIRGGEGFDALSFTEWSKNRGVTIDLNGTTNGHQISSIEKVIGSPLADTIAGTEAAEIFEGGTGNDIFEGKGETDVFLLDRGKGYDLLKTVRVETGLKGTSSHGSGTIVQSVETRRGTIQEEITVLRKVDFSEKVVYGTEDVDPDAIVFGQDITYHDIFGSLAAVDPNQLNLPYEQYFYGSSERRSRGETDSYSSKLISKQELLGRLDNFDLVIGIKSPNSYISNPAPSNFNSSIRVQGGGIFKGDSENAEQAIANVTGFSSEYRLSEESKFVGDGHLISRTVATYQGRQYSFNTSSSLVSRLGFENSAHMDLSQVKYFKDGSAAADTLVADAGKGTWLYGGQLNDNITGNDKGDILVGGTENDLLQGGTGDDQYAYWLGDGHDIITDLSGADAIVFGGGIGEKQIKLKFGKLDNPSLPTSFRDLKAGEEFQSDLKLEIYDPQTNTLSGSITIVNFLPKLTDLQSNIDTQDRLRFAGDIEYTIKQFLEKQGMTVIPPIQWSENKHFYTLTSTAQTWKQAEAEAVAMGGHLVAINSASEQQFLVNTFLSGTNQKIPYWIGLNDAAQERNFVWTTGEAATYTNWERGEPNNDGGEDYTVLNSRRNIGTWNDTESDKYYLGIIEIAPVQPTINLAATPSNVTDNIPIGRDGNDAIGAGDGKDKLLGGEDDDQLSGDNRDDLIDGDRGNDTLIGGTGNDTLVGGLGNDTLTGETGKDRFTFNSPTEGIDQISDFSVVDDAIAVSAAGFNAGLTANAAITSAQLKIGTGATNASERFIYNDANGALLFDQDGNGAIAPTQIATLSTNLALTNLNILVVA